MPDRYANDSYTLEDGFGTTLAGDQVARMALEVQTPFTLGVTGKWGAGKTSVLRRAFVTLGGNPVAMAVPLGEKREDPGSDDWGAWRYSSAVRHPILQWPTEQVEAAKHSLCVWFSPWQHQGADNPLVALLLEIQAQFSDSVKRKAKTNEVARRGALAGLALVERLIDGAVGLHLGRSVKIGEGATDAVRKGWREAVPAPLGLGDGQRFHLLFEDAIATLLEHVGGKDSRRRGGRLIVFIDDLDRCEESVVVQLLESIKLYLGSPSCVFVLAIDETAVLGALKRQWPARSDEANGDYLEKLFQAVIPVPVPRPTAIRDYIQVQLEAHGFPSPIDCAHLVEELIEPNPRKVKNFVNSACAAWGMLTAAGAITADTDLAEAKRFLLFQYLRSQHKEIWRLIERQPWSLRLLGKVLVGTVGQAVVLPDQVQEPEQRMVEHLFVRAFAHILGHAGDQDDHHRFLTITEAVALANERIDRKRSDDCFARYFRALVGIQMDLPQAFLGLTPPLETTHA